MQPQLFMRPYTFFTQVLGPNKAKFGQPFFHKMGVTPGLPAIVLLAIMVPTALGAAFLAVKLSDRVDGGGAAFPAVQRHAIFVLVLAAPFEVWALVRTFGGPGFDLGCVSFASSMLTSVLTLRAVRAQPTRGVSTVRWLQCAQCGPGFVCINYVIAIALSAKLAAPPLLRVYFAIGALTWLMTALTGVRLLQPHARSLAGAGLDADDALIASHQARGGVGES